MPIISVEAMRRGFFDVGAEYGDVLFLSRPADWRWQVTTPNSSTYYVQFHANTADGPVVVDIPAEESAGVFGSIVDAWQVPLIDVGGAGEDGGRVRWSV